MQFAICLHKSICDMLEGALISSYMVLDSLSNTLDWHSPFPLNYIMGSQIRRERPKKRNPSLSPSYLLELTFMLIWIGLSPSSTWGGQFEFTFCLSLAAFQYGLKHHHPYVMSLLLSILCRLQSISRIEFPQLVLY